VSCQHLTHPKTQAPPFCTPISPPKPTPHLAPRCTPKCPPLRLHTPTSPPKPPSSSPAPTCGPASSAPHPWGGWGVCALHCARAGGLHREPYTGRLRTGNGVSSFGSCCVQ
uniref:Uncharacterized protein n=1 Tax=Strigops habroptila TaxID=2489341 RepID=A0A672V825_STRHB